MITNKATKDYCVSRRLAEITFLSMALNGGAHAIDIDAGDYTAAPAGTNVGLLYMQHAESKKLYIDGHQAPVDGRLRTDIGILRAIHFMDFNGYIIDPQILLPFGELRANGSFEKTLGSNAGVGDPILAATLWTLNDPIKRRYFGVTPFIYVPVGTYDHNEALNLGENRWRYALQAGYIHGLGEKFTVDLAADVTLYGDNDEYGSSKQKMEQDPTYQVQAFGRYHVTPSVDFRVGVAHSWIGAIDVDGSTVTDRAKETKFTAGVGYQVNPKLSFLALYGRDLDVTDGFKEQNRFNFRLAVSF
ncbi:transporter (plasmid) [Pseudomonas sp. BYT-5]|uniref:transporter n=1 Tax=Pseudomonas sp. BYT-5 TaxID=2944392 RepID=UPI0020217455|nr:transporter [Pseudomonas sp. BYT-5]URD45380.1 transporter [Pseudomonas sp. BYT-5]